MDGSLKISADDLLAELAELLPKPLDESCEITATILQERTGRAISSCKLLLDSMVAAGEYTSRVCVYHGRRTTAYRRRGCE